MDKLTYIKKHLDKPVVIIGMMGAGKSNMGKFLSSLVDIPYYDSDHEIEYAAKMTVPQIFEKYGETYFRDGERRVIKRLLGNKNSIISTGGGAIMNKDTFSDIKEKSISIWITAEIDILFERISKNKNRPLLQVEDPRGKLEELLQIREPVYSKADITVLSERGSIDKIKDQLIDGLYDFLKEKK